MCLRSLPPLDERTGLFKVELLLLFPGQLYAVGGYDGQERLNTVEVFEPVSKKWRVVAPMLCKRRFEVHSTIFARSFGIFLYCAFA